MPSYQPGIQTREKILNTCKKLFYEKGYDDTTYNDICQEGNINRGLIPYHFKSKYNISRSIFVNFLVDNNSLVRSLIKEKYGDTKLQYAPAVHLRSYLNIIYSDEKFKRFYYQISRVTEFSSNYTDVLESFHRQNIETFKLDLTEIDIKFLTATVTGMSTSTAVLFMHGYLEVSLEDYIDHRIKLFHSLMNIEGKKINEIIEESRRIYSGLNIGLKKYFKLYEIKRSFVMMPTQEH